MPLKLISLNETVSEIKVWLFLAADDVILT